MGRLKQRQHLLLVYSACKNSILLPYQDVRDPGYITTRSSSSASTIVKSLDVFSQGVSFNIVYEDHQPTENCNAPVIVGVPGDLGAASDFQYLVAGLKDAGNRLILLNFPGFGVSSQTTPEETVFHGPKERALLITDFLNAANINSVDVLLSHSAGNWVAYIVAKNDIRIQSIVCLSPVAHRIHRALKLHHFKNVVFYLLGKPWLKTTMEQILIYVYGKVGFNITNVRDVYTSLNFLFRVDFPKAKSTMVKLKLRKLPTLFAFSKKDKLIEWQIPYEAAQILGIPSSHVLVYDENGKPVVPEMEWLDPIVDGVYKRALMFETGTHYIHRSHTERITKNIIELIENVQNKKS